MVVSVNIFVWLNSPLYLDKLLGLKLDSAILTSSNFCEFSGILILVVTIYLWFFKKEENPEKKDGWGLLETLKKMKGFYFN